MKFLEPTITCLVMSHMKPTLYDTLKSICDQTRITDLQVVVIDSGQWFDRKDERANSLRDIFSQFSQLPIIEWYFTGEQKNAKNLYCPVSHWTNVAIKQGLVKGKYLCFGYDDDIYYPTFMEKMAGYLDADPQRLAVRCTQNRTQLKSDGTQESTPPLIADKDISGQNFDCVVDGNQVMLRTEVIRKLEYPYMDENPDISSCSHSDGIFFNRIGSVIDRMHFINEALCEHRNTIYSTYTPSI